MAQKHKTIFGLHSEASFVRAFAKSVGASPRLVTPKRYGAGEWTVHAPADIGREAIVVGNAWEEPQSIFLLSLLVHAVKDAGAKRVKLIAPWIAYGRQDRAARPGEVAAAEVAAGLLLSSGATRIVTLDAHSPTFIRFFHGRLTNILPIEDIVRIAKEKKITAVAAPDYGALQRAKQIAKKLNVPFIQVSKKRIAPGSIEESLASGNPDGKNVLLVDDMADSGKTLFAASCVLRANGAFSVSAFVSHAIDLSRLSKQAKKNGFAWVKAGFDHRTRRMFVDPSLFW